jgi:hypothetical protein
MGGDVFLEVGGNPAGNLHVGLPKAMLFNLV